MKYKNESVQEAQMYRESPVPRVNPVQRMIVTMIFQEVRRESYRNDNTDLHTLLDIAIGNVAQNITQVCDDLKSNSRR